jgi:ABC-type Fe3+/spermidine/putrescine transport system ATPase subunit
MSAIELREVAKHYGPVRAVDEVSCGIEQGEFVTILGPSGSGKTTMLSLIAGLTDPTAGRIFIGGRDVTEMPAAQRNIGLVFQSYALFPNMTVEGNVAFPLEVRRLPRRDIVARVDEVLRLVRLTGLEGRRPSQLSGGQQQRVALARALVFEPHILLLDEPLAALDRKLRDEVRLELRRIQRALGVTTILVTHDQDEALSLSDRLLVLDHGRVQQVGTPDDLYLRPSNRFVADFLGTANLLQGVLRRGSTGCELRLPGGATVPVGKVAAAEGEQVCALLRPERIVLHPCTTPGGLKLTVTESVYHGQSVRYQLRLDEAHELVVVAADRVPRFAAGQGVTATWNPEDVWLIPDAKSAPGEESEHGKE